MFSRMAYKWSIHEILLSTNEKKRIVFRESVLCAHTGKKWPRPICNEVANRFERRSS